MIRIRIDDSELRKFIKEFEIAQKKRAEQLSTALDESADLVLARIYKYLTSGPLYVRTGGLLASIKKSPVYQRADTFWIEVGGGGKVGRAWELGFHVPHHVVRPIPPKKALHFFWKGKEWFLSKAEPGPYSIAPRPWLWPAAEDVMPNIIKIMEKAGAVFLVTRPTPYYGG